MEISYRHHNLSESALIDVTIFKRNQTVQADCGT